jgi:hypothetical protein
MNGLRQWTHANILQLEYDEVGSSDRMDPKKHLIFSPSVLVMKLRSSVLASQLMFPRNRP